jgi:hypothetical protein
VLLGAAVASAALAGPLTPASTFDTDADGWTVSNTNQAVGPIFHDTGGHPGGYISATLADVEQFPGPVYWSAPARFKEAAANAFGGALSFDLRDAGPKKGKFIKGIDLGLYNGSLNLVHHIKKKPGAQRWTHYSVKLDGSKGWIDNDTGKRPTPERMQGVLVGLQWIVIRAEYVKGNPETMDLDNVALTGP